MNKLIQELRQEVKTARKWLSENGVAKPTHQQIARYVINNFPSKLPYGLYWQNDELAETLDISRARCDRSINTRSKLYLSKTRRELCNENAELAIECGVPSEIANPSGKEKITTAYFNELKTYVPQFFKAYVLLRKRGYNKFDLTS